VAGRTYKRWGRNEMPADIAVDSISDSQTKELFRLKAWLYRQRTRTRLDMVRAERREKKEQEKAERMAGQPALFEF
jgi:DNA-directed RNA polymerase specialized sigma24 family protein